MAKRILVVEDELKQQAVIRKRLESGGYLTFGAADGVEGLELAKSEKPDLIVLDLKLPRKSGYEICRELKRDPEYRQIPILMLTAMDQETDVGRGKALGADCYVRKPFDGKLLLAQVAELLARVEQEVIR